MKDFTFIHAADLHLGAALLGNNPSARVEKIFAQAGFTALKRLVSLCLASRASFLLLAGDVYDGNNPTLASRLALRDAFLELEKGGVEVFWACGNHDPLEDGDYGLRWPGNVHRFGPEPEFFLAGGKNAPLACIHGVSFNRSKETGNLALGFKRAAANSGFGPGLLQIGLLHCLVEGQASRQNGKKLKRYSPCALSDLLEAGMDYWALGHVHDGNVVSMSPPVIYPGSVQGLHINENGAHGCFVARVTKDGGLEPRFQPLAPLRWEKLVLDVGGAEGEAPQTLDALEDFILQALKEHAAKIKKEIETEQGENPALSACSLLVCRLTLRGRSVLDKTLRLLENKNSGKNGGMEELLDRLREAVPGLPFALPLWIKDMELATTPDVNIEKMRERDDLLGECFRLADELAGELRAAAPEIERAENSATALSLLPPELLKALGPLYNAPKARDWLRAPGPNELEDLLRQAAALCLDLLRHE